MEDPKQYRPPAATDTATTGRTWEYQVTTVTGGTDVLRAELDTAGANGFELVTCESRPSHLQCWVIVLKRPAGVA